MPDTGYIISACGIVFVITLSLRALPFVALKALRESAVVKVLALWMPAGILGILAASTLRKSIESQPSDSALALIAVVVAAATHLLGGRRTLLSVGAGTLTFVLLVNVF